MKWYDKKSNHTCNDQSKAVSVKSMQTNKLRSMARQVEAGGSDFKRDAGVKGNHYCETEGT